jgi:hypothetical protein
MESLMCKLSETAGVLVRSPAEVASQTRFPVAEPGRCRQKAPPTCCMIPQPRALRRRSVQ